MSKYDIIEEIKKFNPFHDAQGKFSNSNGGVSFTFRTKNPDHQHWADMAVARQKDKASAGGGGTGGSAGQKLNISNHDEIVEFRSHLTEHDNDTLMEAWKQTREDTTPEGIVVNTQIEFELEQRGLIFMNDDTFEYETLNTGGKRQRVEGKDITDQIEIEHAAGKGATFDEVLQKQGFKGKPQVVSAEEFDKAVEESGIIGFRTINDGTDIVSGSERTSGQFAEQLKHGEPEQVSMNGSGAKVFGDGIYIATNQHVTPGKKPTEEDIDNASRDSKAYGWDNPSMVTCTLHPKAKVIESKDLFNAFENLPDSVQKAYGWDRNAWAAAKGYDAVLAKWGGVGCDYTVVLNRSALIFREGHEKLAE